MSFSNKIWQRYVVANSSHFWQLVRFGISGAALTALVSAAYFVQVTFTAILPAIALTLATVAGSAMGYFVHGRFSFRGFGARENPAKRFARFLITNGIGYLLNLSLVFALIDLAHLPKWTPILGFCFVTPIVTFFLNRNWVFG